MAEDKNIKVEYLCRQPFWNFKTSDKSEFCKMCKHSMHDFSTMGLEEINSVIKNSGGKTCGSFYPDQFVISEKTQYSPTLYRLVLASAITFLSTTSSSKAQNATSDSVKTEQHYNANEIEMEKLFPVCISPEESQVVNDKDNEPKEYKRKSRGIKLFRIGRRSFYLSARFPFFRSYRKFRGKVSYTRCF